MPEINCELLKFLHIRRDKRGVPFLRLDYRDPLAIEVHGAVLLASAFILIVIGLSWAGWVPWYGGGVGFIGALLMARYLAVRRQIRRLSNAQEISQRLGVSVERLPRIVKKHGIKPRFDVNGEDLYDLADFGEAAILLRASSAPAPTEELLRPAANSETPTELLLRPASSDATKNTIAESKTDVASGEEVVHLHLGG